MDNRAYHLETSSSGLEVNKKAVARSGMVCHERMIYETTVFMIS